MNIDDIFEFGQYKSLSLKDVYQGTLNINRELLRNFLINCLGDKNVPKPHIFDFLEIQIGFEEINIDPNIFNEEKLESMQNTILIGNLAGDLQNYFNYFFSPNLRGITQSFERFNRSNLSTVIGGNPEYLIWCSKEIQEFTLNSQTKDELEKLQVHRLKGISVEQREGYQNSYVYKPIIRTEYFQF